MSHHGIHQWFCHIATFYLFMLDYNIRELLCHTTTLIKCDVTLGFFHIAKFIKGCLGLQQFLMVISDWDIHLAILMVMSHDEIHKM
jgi:hypothetical protein